MRALLAAALVVVCGVVVGVLAPAGQATTSTPGDGCFVVQDGLGKVYVSLTRGVVFGRFAVGTVKFDDVIAGDGSPPKVFGAPPVKVSENWTSYSGDEIRFRTTGAVRISFVGQLLDLSVVGKGTAVVSSTGLDFAGTYSVDAPSFCQDNFQAMPQLATRLQIANPITG